MMVQFILVTKILLNKKRDNNKQGRLQENLKQFRYFKQKEIKHMGKNKNGFDPNLFLYSPPTNYEDGRQQP